MTESAREAVFRLLRGLAAVVALAIVAVGVAGCGDSGSDNEGAARLTVVDLDEVQGWRLRAEAFSPGLDGSPTFYFSDTEQVVGSSMTSADTSLGARAYVLVVELAEPGGEIRTCEADLVVSAGESLKLTVRAESLVEPAESTTPPACSLATERSGSE